MLLLLLALLLIGRIPITLNLVLPLCQLTFQTIPRSMPEESKAVTKKSSMNERMEKYKDNVVDPQDKKEVEDLPRWVKTALVLKNLDGMSFKTAAERVNRNPSTLSKYSRSPAAHKWLESLLEFIDDPIELAKAYLKGNALSITVDRVVCLDAAIAAGDYKAADAIAKDIQEKLGIVSPKTKTDVAPVLNITIGSGSVEIPAIEAAWEEVKDEEDD